MSQAKIMVVEDERITAEMISLILNNLGYEVSAIVSSGRDVLREAEENKPDLVLMDIQLNGEMDGISAAEQIRSRIGIPVVYLTAYADQEILRRAKISEPFGYLLKPFEERGLHSAIEIALYKHKMESKLRETQEWLSATLKSIGDAVIAADNNGLVTYMNLMTEIMTGWKQNEVVGQDVMKFFSMDGKIKERNLKALISGVKETSSIFGISDICLITKNKEKIPVEGSFAPVRDGRGNICEVILAIRPVTHRKRASERLEKIDTSFHNVVDKSPDGIIIVDREGTVQFVNPTAEKYLGCKEDKMLGERFNYAVVPEEAGEIEIIRLNGEKGYGELRTAKTLWQKDQSYLVSIRDVTDRKNAMAEFEKALMHQIRTRDQFLSHISHELRTPLSVIHQFTSILLDGMDGSITSEQREDLEIISKNSNQLSTMIRDLLDVTRVITGKLSVDPQPVRVIDVVMGALDFFYYRAAAKRISFRHDITENLQPVYADPSRLNQIFGNLLDNAIKFTPEDGQITISAGRSKEYRGYMLFEVSDTGCGIDLNEKNLVFDYLYQAKDSLRSKSKGLGLGLYICKEIVTRHGGKIWVDSRPGKGSTFYFTLPVYSLTKILSSLMTPANLHKGSWALITVAGYPLSPGIPKKIWENVNRVVSDVLKACISSDSEVLLPQKNSMNTSMVFILVACAQRNEAEQKTEHIEKEIGLCEAIKNIGVKVSVSFTMLDISDYKNNKQIKRIVSHIVQRAEEIEKDKMSRIGGFMRMEKRIQVTEDIMDQEKPLTLSK